jgi:hypothetical protein
VFVSDEEDQSPKNVSDYLSFFQSLKKGNPGMVSVSSIVGPVNINSCATASSAGLRYIELADKTGGVTDSICTPDWTSSLEKIGKSAFGPRTVFPLTAKPSDAARIVVKVNGANVGAGPAWAYDAVGNAVVFDSAAAPVAGSHIEITYPMGCS